MNHWSIKSYGYIGNVNTYILRTVLRKCADNGRRAPYSRLPQIRNFLNRIKRLFQSNVSIVIYISFNIDCVAWINAGCGLEGQNYIGYSNSFIKIYIPFGISNKNIIFLGF